MFNNTPDIYEKITFKLIDSLQLEDISWLKDEVTQLLLIEPKLTNLLQSVTVTSVASAIDNYFDKERVWSSQRVLSIAEQLMCAEDGDSKDYTLITFINAGLTVKLAIYALEETKYACQTSPRVNINYLPAIFQLNAELRKKTLNEAGSNDSFSESTSTRFPNLKNSTTKRKPKRN
jgi:hypothetical protein